MPIRLMENFRAVFYAPYYATVALGFYKGEGVDVELLTSNAPGDAVPKLIDGAIDLTWGGPMRVMKAHDQDANSPLVNFCEVVSRDPFFLIGRRGQEQFSLSDLHRLRFASASEVPTPWMCLQQDLRDRGIDPLRLPRDPDGSMPQNYRGLRAGELDVIQTFEPFVSMAEHEFGAEILHAASTRGPTTYTAFISTRATCVRHRNEFAAINRATSRALGWLRENSPEELARAVSTFFPDVSAEILVSSLRRYRDAGIWTCDTRMDPRGFARLSQSLLSGGLIDRAARYEECVDEHLNGAVPL